MPAVIAFLGYDPHPDPKTVGETLRTYRRALGFTQRELGAQLGMDRSTVSKVETGKEGPSEAMLQRIRAFPGALWDSNLGAASGQRGCAGQLGNGPLHA